MYQCSSLRLGFVSDPSMHLVSQNKEKKSYLLQVMTPGPASWIGLILCTSRLREPPACENVHCQEPGGYFTVSCFIWNLHHYVQIDCPQAAAVKKISTTIKIEFSHGHGRPPKLSNLLSTVVLQKWVPRHADTFHISTPRLLQIFSLASLDMSSHWHSNFFFLFLSQMLR